MIIPNRSVARQYLASASLEDLADALISEIPWFYEQKGVQFGAWARQILDSEQCDPKARLYLVGSGAVGFSLSPEKAGAPFRPLSTSDSAKLTNERLRNWKSKTEFYSLFLAAGRCVSDGLVPTGKMLAAAVSRLNDFRDKVDIAKRRGNQQRFEDYVHKYVDAVARASTDLTRRQLRIDIVYSLIQGEEPR